MKTLIEKLFASIRQKLMAWRIHREIERFMFPQLTGNRNCGYPFRDSEEELEKLAAFGGFDAQLNLDIIERQARELPETYGKAFRYIMYRDLNTRMKTYLEFVRERTPRKAASIALKPELAT